MKCDAYRYVAQVLRKKGSQRLKNNANNEYNMAWMYVAIVVVIAALLIPIGSIPVTEVNFSSGSPDVKVYSEGISPLFYTILSFSANPIRGDLLINLTIETTNNFNLSREYWLNQDKWTIRYPVLVSKGDKIIVEIPSFSYRNEMVIPVG